MVPVRQSIEPELRRRHQALAVADLSTHAERQTGQERIVRRADPQLHLHAAGRVLEVRRAPPHELELETGGDGRIDLR
jgi:hypothetical protein